MDMIILTYPSEQFEKSLESSGPSNQQIQQTHSNGKPYQCEFCEKGFSHIYSLKRHRRMHTNMEQYHCKQCEKSFPRLDNFKRHMLTHTIHEKPYHCERCNKRFTQSCNLKQHMRTHTNKKLYLCKLCEKRFSQLSTYEHHKATHWYEKPYQCQHCGKSFGRSSCVKRHIKTHTNERPYHCEQCEKSFANSGYLKKHMITHTNEKLYHCQQCEKSFARSGTLKSHMRTHTNERAYHCEQCGKSFYESSNLKQHMVTHTNKKPYQCEQCEKSFSRSGTLKNHIQRKHICTNKMLYCNLCDISFHFSHNHECHMQTYAIEMLEDINRFKTHSSSKKVIKMHPAKKHKLQNFTYINAKGKNVIETPNSANRLHCDQCESIYSQLSNQKHSLIIHRGEECTYTWETINDRKQLTVTLNRQYKCSSKKEQKTQSTVHAGFIVERRRDEMEGFRLYSSTHYNTYQEIVL
uniref:Zinc finger protein 184-like n=1 Tax=Saccoglossus kowalevskii TaxID=10224 RepID=A0ABM0GIJ0_SACKO|nr:PREDICTED: zinc finger protein 184-like [Saccoglossus kowalevskii]